VTATGLVVSLAATALLSAAGPAASQQVPARDLWRLPLGTMDRAPALANAVGDGLGNPASVALGDSERLRVGAAALQTPAELGVAGQLLAAAVRLRSEITVGLSIAHLAVSDLVRTDSDPVAVEPGIPYGTTLYSLTVARRHASRISTAIAIRYRNGELDGEQSGTFVVDAGVLAERIPFRDASVGVSTFLWQPGNEDPEGTTIHVAADLRVVGPDAVHQLRGGYSLTAAGQRYREHFVSAAGRYGIWEGRAGLARATVYGGQPWRSRLGVLLHYEPYAVGVAREENSAGLTATYQFTLRATIR
jgi:hypothetical protein